MEGIAVSNRRLTRNIKTITWASFQDMAFSDEGMDFTGDLYMDISVINKNIYDALSASGIGIKYFRLDDTEAPFIDEVILDWKEYLYEPSSSDLDFLSEDDYESLGISNTKNKGEVSGDDIVTENYSDQKQARIVLFGSSKGGAGKTFTALMSAYRYAKKHPDKKIAVSDFDIIDGQVGISIHKISPTMLDYYKRYQVGYDDFETMSKFKVKSDNFPGNIDFYLSPKDIYIENDDFWDSIFINLIENYDVVFFDSGIDYMNYKPISTLYKIADKIVLVSTTSIKSVSSVTKQIARLKGEMKNNVFTPEDEIGKKLNLVITQADRKDPMNRDIVARFRASVNVLGIFGVLTDKIHQAEYFGFWNIFDKRKDINSLLDKLAE